MRCYGYSLHCSLILLIQQIIVPRLYYSKGYDFVFNGLKFIVFLSKKSDSNTKKLKKKCRYNMMWIRCMRPVLELVATNKNRIF